MREQVAENAVPIEFVTVIHTAIRVVLEGPDGLHAKGSTKRNLEKNREYTRGYKAGKKDAAADKAAGRGPQKLAVIGSVFFFLPFYIGYRRGYAVEYSDED